KTSRQSAFRRADGPMTQLGRMIESITYDSPALVTKEKGQPMTEKMLRTRFDTARKSAAEEAIKACDQDLAREIMQFQFRNIRPKA
ncbi:integrase, partial [Pseudomonas aeruginosa]